MEATPPPSLRPHGLPAARSGGGMVSYGEGAGAARVWGASPSPTRGREETKGNPLLAFHLLIYKLSRLI
jgi:hypothetical protein